MCGHTRLPSRSQSPTYNSSNNWALTRLCIHLPPTRLQHREHFTNNRQTVKPKKPITAREECTALIFAHKADYYQNRLKKTNNKTMFRHPKGVNYFHISSIKRSTNSCRVSTASTSSIGQQIKKLFYRLYPCI